ncbi:MAG: alpha/beta hydrolase fold domain-containing protein [Bacteroidales bacterium]|nr:alpha/beta hydrolase fold domain-containing protein [Bacteroidales bacterium]
MKKHTLHFFFSSVFIISIILSQSATIKADDPDQISIWDSTGPGSDTLTIQEKVTYRSLSGTCTSDRAIEHITIPTITPFVPENPNGTAIILCPGGAYQRVVYDVEGCDIARWYNQLGITAFVLKYRLPVDKHFDSRYVPLQDAQRAMRYIKMNAATWGIDTSKVGIMGASAGGHLAASLGTDFNKQVYTPVAAMDSISARPGFMVLLYPVISMDSSITHIGSRENLLGKEYTQEMLDEFSAEKQVKTNTPATFMARAADDYGVNRGNCERFDQALRDAGINSQLNIYINGGHGVGICKAGTSDLANWPRDCQNWLVSQGLIADSFYISGVREVGEWNIKPLYVYPNPVEGYAKLAYSVTKENFVDISVFDVSGRRLGNLVNRHHTSGIYEIELKKSLFPSGGIYFVKLNNNNMVFKQKVIVY